VQPGVYTFLTSNLTYSNCLCRIRPGYRQVPVAVEWAARPGWASR